MLAGASAPAAAAPVFSPSFRLELETLFAWRRDVRRFRADPVDAPLLRRVMAAAGTAPSVGLSEPWRIVEVATAEARRRTVENFKAENIAALAAQPEDRRSAYAALKLAGLEEAPVHLAVFCDEAGGQGGGLGTRTMPEMRRYSVVCAAMQMWLAARAEGLGMGWVSILDPDRLIRDLDVPREWTLVAYLCLGWPVEEHGDAELERAGWEARRRMSNRILKR